MLHRLKIKPCYLLRILDGSKTFEIRKNDRDFQVGDTIEFEPVREDDEPECVQKAMYNIKLPIPEYTITYILSDSGGLQQRHVCLAIRQATPVLGAALLGALGALVTKPIRE